MSLARYFVFPRNEEWLITLDGVCLARQGSRAAAVHSAIVMADLMGSMKYDADVMLEDEGRMGLAWTYGSDPLPTETDKAAA